MEITPSTPNSRCTCDCHVSQLRPDKWPAKIGRSNIMQRRDRTPLLYLTRAVVAMTAICPAFIGGVPLARAQALTASETVLHSFAAPPHGSSVAFGLVRDGAGNLYGTTASGGSSNDGVVFKLSSSGKQTVLHSFSGGTDGRQPSGASHGTPPAISTAQRWRAVFPTMEWCLRLTQRGLRPYCTASQEAWMAVTQGAA